MASRPQFQRFRSGTGVDAADPCADPRSASTLPAEKKTGAKSMNPEPTVVGILSPSAETRELLRKRLRAANLASLTVEGDRCSPDKSDRSTRRFVEAQPHVILVDMHDPQEALQSLQILHDVLPEAWLFVSSGSNDPQLIIETMRAGAREFLPKPLTLSSLHQAFARFSAERQKAVENRPQGKIYSITAAKGGAGTTSVAVNLAVALATAQEAKVALIDLGSPVGDAAEHLNLKSRFNVSDAISSAERLDPVLLESYMSRAHGVSVLPGHKEFRPGALHSEAVAKILHVASAAYTHVFVDMFCSHEKEQLAVLTEISTAVILVLTPELPALWRTDWLMRFFEKANGAEKLKLVVNRNSRRNEISNKDIEKALGQSVFWRLPNNYPASIQAINSGQPLVLFDHSTLASSYYDLAEALSDMPLRQKRRGFFGLFS